MTYEKGVKVFSCCGQYIVPTKAVADKKIVCPRCGKRQTIPLKYPTVLLVKS